MKNNAPAAGAIALEVPTFVRGPPPLGQTDDMCINLNYNSYINLNQLQSDTFYIPRGQGGPQLHFLKYTVKGLFRKHCSQAVIAGRSIYQGAPSS